MSEQITTAEELDALPVGSVVMERDGTPHSDIPPLTYMPGVFHRFPSGWFIVAGHGARTDFQYPLTVLHRPDRDLLAEAEGRAEDRGYWKGYSQGLTDTLDRPDLARHWLETSPYATHRTEQQTGGAS